MKLNSKRRRPESWSRATLIQAAVYHYLRAELDGYTRFVEMMTGWKIDDIAAARAALLATKTP